MVSRITTKTEAEQRAAGSADVGRPIALGVSSLGGSIDVPLDVGEFPDSDELLDEDEIVYVYLTEADERVRPEHAALHGTVWDPDDPELPIPPLGPNCRCRLEARAKTKEIAAATGIRQVEAKPPEPGPEAMRAFWEDAEHSETGESLKPQDTLGAKVGGMVDKGELSLENALDAGGEQLTALPAGTRNLVAEGIANQGNSRKVAPLVFAAVVRLDAMGLNPARVRAALSLAKRLRASYTSDIGAVTEALIRLRLGMIPGRSLAVTRQRAERAAKQILRAWGPL